MPRQRRRRSHHRHRGLNDQGHKRRHEQQYDEEEAEESVDDLAIASMYAFARPPEVDCTFDVDVSSSSEAESSDGESSDEESDCDSSEHDLSSSERAAKDFDDESGLSQEESSSSDDESQDGSSEKIAEKKIDVGEGESDADKDDGDALENPDGIEDSQDNEGSRDSLDSKDRKAGLKLNGTAAVTEVAGNTAVKHVKEDGGLPSSSNRRKKGRRKANENPNDASSIPRTKNEIDPYHCPTDQLKMLNVGGLGSAKQSATRRLTEDVDGGLILDAGIKKQLKIAGTIRSYIVEQRTVVVDSFVPFTVQNQWQNAVTSPLGEGSLLVVVTKQADDDGKPVAVSLDEVDDSDEACSLQMLGTIMEVFGPVQRPLYAIRLPDPPKLEMVTRKAKDAKSKIQDSMNNVDRSELDEEDMEAPVKEERCAGNVRTLEVNAKAQNPIKGENDSEERKETGIDAVAENEGKYRREETLEAVAKAQDLSANNEDKSMQGGSLTMEKQEARTTHLRIKGEELKHSTHTRPSNCGIDKMNKTKEDPWSSNGKLSIMLKSCPQAAIYSLVDHAKLINTDHVIKASGKGCDASNKYDEEGDEEQYFSDDQEERAAMKNRRPRHSHDDNEEGNSGKHRGVGVGRGRGGRGNGRYGRGRGRGRGERGSSHHHGNGSFGLALHTQQQPQYPQRHPQSNQQLYCNQHTSQRVPPPNLYSHISGLPSVEQCQNQQQYLYQHQYQQHQQPYYGGQPYQPSQDHNQAIIYSGPPPPPPPRGNMPAAAQPSHPSSQTFPVQQLSPAAENDTVYYDYS